MRITRLKLKNFIGIKHGLGRDEIEIEFPNNGKLITMLNGQNGSGKSCILSTLHPFKDSFDDRKTLILEGKEGLKEIDIEDGENKYEIRHIYSKKAQSFIKKNGKELNENGGVRTFNEIVFNELGLTSDYFKIGKIGSNTSSFIDFTAADRKTFISKFLPNIEDYIEKFNIVKEKFRTTSSDIKSVSADLAKLQDKETILQLITSNKKSKESTENQIESLSGSIAVLNTRLNEIQNELNQIDINNLNLVLQQKEKQKAETENVARQFMNKYQHNVSTPDLEVLISEKTEDLNKLNTEITVINTQLQSLNAVLVNQKNDLIKKNNKLSEIESLESLDDLLIKRTNLQETILKNTEVLNSNTIYSNLNNNNLTEFKSKFQALFQFLDSHYTELNNHSFNLQQRNIEIFLTTDSSESLQRYIARAQAVYTEKKQSLEELINSYNRLSLNLNKLEILEKRPSECSISECPFIKDALAYKNLPNDLANLNTQITSLKKEVSEYETKLGTFADLKSLAESVNAYITAVNVRQNSIYLYYMERYGSIENALNLPLNEFKESYLNQINTVETLISAMEELNLNQQELNNLNAKIKYVESIESIQKEYLTEIENIKTEIEKSKNKINELNSKLKNELVPQSNNLSEFITDHQNFLNGKKTYKELNNSITEIKTQIQNYNNLVDEQKVKNSNYQADTIQLNQLKQQKTDIENQLISYQHQYEKILELEKKKTNLESNYENLKLVKDSLDPNKGIPLYFIKSYLEQTQDISNNLLNVAYNGRFEISFVTSSNEFFIRVRSGDNIKNDIKEASQGEIALTTISISLALIEQSIGRFNVLCLDEIDGALDQSNRQNFISILEKQAKKLGIEQIFVISHNDVFDRCPMNLILLNGNTVDEDDSEYMKNKEIIFQV